MSIYLFLHILDHSIVSIVIFIDKNIIYNMCLKQALVLPVSDLKRSKNTRMHLKCMLCLYRGKEDLPRMSTGKLNLGDRNIESRKKNQRRE